ncbi:MAG: rhodanese-like domain-containing protein [Oculatellaceae cyanobacterium Prado106]|nr:rhodanese-like domain-containing protein [Oculatellaceae cyanobacterium Prado106]
MNLRFGIFPVPPPLKPKCRVYDLKARLDWGEPALTIIDVRDRHEFAVSHIVGAVNLPMSSLVQQALIHLELDRDLYICGDTDEEIVEAATQLRASGYLNVAEIQGGLPAWKAVGYPVEAGVATAIPLR